MEYNPCINLSNKEKAYISVARYLATKSKSRNKHGSVIVKSGRVIGTGYNKDKNNPHSISEEHIKLHASRHAEIEAIRDAGWDVKGAVLYVARVNNLGYDRDSRPCASCSEIIEQHEIKRVIYTESVM